MHQSCTVWRLKCRNNFSALDKNSRFLQYVLEISCTCAAFYTCVGNFLVPVLMCRKFSCTCTHVQEIFLHLYSCVGNFPAVCWKISCTCSVQICTKASLVPRLLILGISKISYFFWNMLLTIYQNFQLSVYTYNDMQKQK